MPAEELVYKDVCGIKLDGPNTNPATTHGQGDVIIK